MKRFFLLFIFIAGIVFDAGAITKMYRTGIGFRAGKFNSGFSFKYFYDSNPTIGIQLDAYITDMADGGLTGKGFYIRQIPFKLPIIQIPLDFVYGGGLHVGYFPLVDKGYYKIRDGNAVFYNKSVFTAGVDATVQIEYQVSRKVAPLTITIDVVPFYEFYHEGPENVDIGISLRYTFQYATRFEKR